MKFEDGQHGLAWAKCRMVLLGSVLLLCTCILLGTWMNWFRLLAIWCYVPSFAAFLLAVVTLLPGTLERGWARLAYPALCFAGFAPFVTLDARNANHTPFLSIGALLAVLAALWLIQEVNQFIGHAKIGPCFPGEPRMAGRFLSAATLYGVLVPLVAIYIAVLCNSSKAWNNLNLLTCWETPPAMLLWTGWTVYWIALAILLLQAVLVLCMAADLGRNQENLHGDEA